MVLQINFTPDEEEALRQIAEQRGVALEEMAKQELMKLTQVVDDDTFKANLEASIRDNDELLRRLA